MSNSYHKDKGPFLRELVEGERFMGFYLLRSKHLEPFRDPSKGYYLSLVLGDRSGQLLGRVWENAEEAAEEILQGEVLKIDGEIENYLGRLKARIFRVRPAKPNEYDLRDMLPTSPKDPAEMLASLDDHMGKITNPHLAGLVDHFFGDSEFRDHFSQAPAAKQIHHAYLHGLLEHTLEALQLAEKLIELFPALNADLLRTGVLLHDIGKVKEYTWETDINFTDPGRLVGHIVLADEMLSQALQSLPDFPSDLGLQLRHMLLAHHGRLRWGSPRRPHTLEAIALHQIENMSAQINRFQTLLEKRPAEETWTDYDRLLGRQLYGAAADDPEDRIADPSKY